VPVNRIKARQTVRAAVSRPAATLVTGRVDVVGEPSATVNGAVAGMRKFVPVTTRPVKNSLKDLSTLTEQIDYDAWKAKGVTLSNWAPTRTATRLGCGSPTTHLRRRSS